MLCSENDAFHSWRAPSAVWEEAELEGGERTFGTRSVEKQGVNEGPCSNLLVHACTYLVSVLAPKHGSGSSKPSCLIS